MVKEFDFDADAAPELRCCGELPDVDVDPGGADDQTFELDCTVCYRPCRAHMSRDEDGEETEETGTLEREDE